MSLPIIRKQIEARVQDTGDTMTGSLKVTGRYQGSGDDEGVLIGQASNGYAGLILGDPAARRSVFYLNNDTSKNPWWRYNDGTSSFDISHPGKSGTIALTSDLIALDNNYLKLSGGTLTGSLYGTNIIPSTAGSGALGQSGIPWLNIHSRNYYTYDVNFNQNGRWYTSQSGTVADQGTSMLVVGNDIPSGTTGNSRGQLRLYDTTSYRANLVTSTLDANITIKLPNIGATLMNMKKNIFEQKNLIFDLSAYSSGNSSTNMKTWMDATGKLVFIPETGDSQNLYLIPTQYDNVRTPAGFVIGGTQGGEYLWTMGDLITNTKLVFHKQYTNKGEPREAGAISGDTVLQYIHNPAGTLDTSSILTIYAPADVNGICPVLGGGAATVVAAGECYSSIPSTAWTEESYSASSENLFLGADGSLIIYTNCNTIANRKKTTISTAGALVVPTHTDYTTYKARNTAANTSAMTASSTSLSNGNIYLQYT